MNDLLKVLCIIMIAGCVALMFYSFIYTWLTVKRNKEKDKLNQTAFVTEMEMEARKKTANLKNDVPATQDEDIARTQPMVQSNTKVNLDSKGAVLTPDPQEIKPVEIEPLPIPTDCHSLGKLFHQ